MRLAVHSAIGAAVMAALPSSPAWTAPEIELLEARLPGVDVQAIRPSVAVPGLYEAVLGDGSLLYVDGSARTVIRGEAFDLATRRNLTEESLLAGYWTNFASVPVDLAIRIVKGTGRRKMALLADPDCPFCEQLERTLATVDDVTIYLLLLPLPQLHPDAVARSHAIWCSPAPAAAWESWMLRQAPPAAAAAGCVAPLADIARFGMKVGARGTPHLVFGSGRVASGALPREALQYYLDEVAPAAR